MEKILRLSLALGKLEAEEERRILYVALTRAMDLLIITRVSGGGVPGQGAGAERAGECLLP